MTDDADLDLVHQMQERGAAERRAKALRMAEERKYGPREAKPKKAKRGTPERDAQRAVVAWLRLCGCLVNASVNEQRSASNDPDAAARFGAARKKSGVTSGWPDLSVALQTGRTVYIEMKSGVGRLSPAQRQVHAWLQQHGHIVIVATSVETVAAGLQAVGIVVGQRSRRASP